MTALGKTMFTFEVDVNAPDVYGEFALDSAEDVNPTFQEVEAPAAPVASVKLTALTAVAPTVP